MSFKSILRRILEKTSPGRSPSYSEAQVLKTLELTSKNWIGRTTLSSELGIGEGMARTLIRHLVREGFIEVSMRGITSSSKGRKLLDQVRVSITSGCEAIKTPDTVGEKNYAILVKNASDKVRNGLEQRDAALLAGSKGATTLVYYDSLWIPGMERKPDRELEKYILKEHRPEKGDVVIIGTGETLLKAELGAFSAALTLI
jgi:hypothetical protein